MVEAIIALALGLLCFSGFIVMMGEDDVAAILGYFVMSMAFFAMGGTILHQEGHKAGQIDALNDRIIYELVEQPNGESVWEKIENK